MFFTHQCNFEQASLRDIGFDQCAVRFLLIMAFVVQS